MFQHACWTQKEAIAVITFDRRVGLFKVTSFCVLLSHLAQGNFLGWQYFRLSLYSTVTNLLCTGTAAGSPMFTGQATCIFPASASMMLGLMGTKAVFSAVMSLSGGGRSPPSDRSTAMAVFVSSLVAFTVTVPINDDWAVTAADEEVEASASVEGTCTVWSLVVVAVFPADKGDIVLGFL